MPTQGKPEARALLAVFLVIIASALLHTVIQTFNRIDTAAARSEDMIIISEELQEKVDDLETQVEELSEQLSEIR